MDLTIYSWQLYADFGKNVDFSLTSQLKIGVIDSGCSEALTSCDFKSFKRLCNAALNWSLWFFEILRYIIKCVDLCTSSIINATKIPLMLNFHSNDNDYIFFLSWCIHRWFICFFILFYKDIHNLLPLAEATTSLLSSFYSSPSTLYN